MLFSLLKKIECFVCIYQDLPKKTMVFAWLFIAITCLSFLLSVPFLLMFAGVCGGGLDLSVGAEAVVDGTGSKWLKQLRVFLAFFFCFVFGWG